MTWHLRIIASETLAIVKDTDKEDRETALKLSWEQHQPGRGDLASKSRQRWLLQKKKAEGEELTEEEAAFLVENRERGRKKE